MSKNKDSPLFLIDIMGNSRGDLQDFMQASAAAYNDRSSSLPPFEGRFICAVGQCREWSSTLAEFREHIGQAHSGRNASGTTPIGYRYTFAEGDSRDSSTITSSSLTELGENILEIHADRAVKHQESAFPYRGSQFGYTPTSSIQAQATKDLAPGKVSASTRASEFKSPAKSMKKS